MSEIKLWVDDIRTPPDDSWNICRDVSSAIRALYMFREQVTEVNLDHDISHQVVLGGMSRPYPCTETFKAVAIFMAVLQNQYPDWQPKVRIHTSNHSGAHAMREILDRFKNVETVIAPGANRLETIL